MSIFDELPELLNDDFVENYDFEKCWTRLNPNSIYEKLDLAAAILAFRGNYSRMAKALGRSRRVVEGYVLRDIGLADLREDVRNSILDMIEEGYMLDAENGDSQARRFFLQTLGKERGYVVRNESTGKDGEPIHLKSQVNFKKMDDASIEQFLGAVSGNNDAG